MEDEPYERGGYVEDGDGLQLSSMKLSCFLALVEEEEQVED